MKQIIDDGWFYILNNYEQLLFQIVQLQNKEHIDIVLAFLRKTDNDDVAIYDQKGLIKYIENKEKVASLKQYLATRYGI